MEKLKEYKYIILIMLLILAGAFYWYEWRPTQAKRECFIYADTTIHTPKVTEDGIVIPFLTEGEFLRRNKNFERLYENCLRKKGF